MRDATTGVRPLGALRHCDFLLIAIGNMVSQIGFWGQYVGVGWVAKRVLHGSNLLVTLAFGAQWLPMLLLSSITGVLADRYNRRLIVLWGNIAMVLPPAALGLLVQTHHISKGSLLALVSLTGIGQAFTQPAASALVPSLVPMADLHSAIALNAGMVNATRIIGPSTFGLVTTTVGPEWGFYANAISYLAVAAACLFVRARPPRPNASGHSVLNELRLGIAYARQQRAVLLLLLLIGTVSFLNMHPPLLAIWASDVLHGDASTFGLLAAAPGFGTVAAAALTTSLATGRQRRAMLGISSFMIAIVLIGFALSRTTVVSLVFLGLWGMFFTTLTTLISTLLVAASDDEYRGRVMGLLATCQLGAIPISAVVAGVSSTVFSAPTTVLGCAATILVFSSWFFRKKNIHALRDGTEPKGDALVATADHGGGRSP
ncbi:MAG: MFS transporter [Actinomycetota bacterium]